MKPAPSIEHGIDLREMPIIRSSVRKSKDGQYIIQQTTITSIKPVAYYEAVMARKPEWDKTEDQ